MPHLSRSIAFALVALFAACTTSPSQRPQVPDALQPPATETMFLEVRASGSQIYQCAAKPDGSLGWAFKAPEAVLSARSGQVVGKHYAGPTWELADGSEVVGLLKASSPAPVAAAIPWLLLTAKSTAGVGTLNGVTSIQRVDTVGGIAPAQPCAADIVQQTVNVPYTATYFFYRAGKA